MNKKRSIGVTIFAWLYLSNVLICILVILTTRSRSLAWQEETQILLPGGYYMLAQSQAIINSIVCLISGIGLLKLLKWARGFIVIVTIIHYFYGIALYFLYTRTYIIPAFAKANRQMVFSGVITGIVWILGLLWVVFVVYYFTRPKVKEQFK